MEYFSLSMSQYRILIEYLLNSNSLEYNNILYFQFNGELDIRKLEGAINTIIEIFPEMRLSIIEKDGEYLQKINNYRFYSLPFFDISTLPLKQEQQKIILKASFEKPYDVYTYPCFRLIVIKVAEKNFLFGLSWQHLFTDAIAVEIFLQKLEAYYNEPKLYEKAINYQLIAFQKENIYRANSNYQNETNYWVKKLTSFNLTDFHNDSLFLAKKGKRVHWNLLYFLSKRLSNYLIDKKVSLFVFMASALGISLGKLTKNQKIVMCYSINTREKDSIKSAGYFVNTLPLCIKLTNRMNFTDVLSMISEQRLNDKKFQNVPLLDVISACSLNINLDFRKILSISLNQYTYLSFQLNLNNCTAYPVPVNEVDISTGLILRYDLCNNLKLEIDYNDVLYTEKFIQQLIYTITEVIENALINN